MQKIIGIVAVLLLLVFAGYKIFIGRVNWEDPNSVAAAFLAKLKSEDTDAAKKYYLPDQADTWADATHEKLYRMKSNENAGFKESIPDKPVFTPAPTPKAVPGKPASGDKFLQTGGVTVGLRQIGDKWYVSQSPY